MGGGISRLLIAVAMVGAVVATVNPAAAQVVACSNTGWIENQSVIAEGCVRSGGGPGPAGAPTPIRCEYSTQIADDSTSPVAVYRTAGGFETGSAADSSATQIDITGVTVLVGEWGSSVEFEQLVVTGGDRQFSPTGRWYTERCYDDSLPPGSRLISVEGPIPGGRPVPISDVVDRALANLTVTAPSAFEHSGPASVLNLSTFFWLETIDFDGPPQTASDGFGNVQVTVEAQPSSFYLDYDSERIECGDRNTPWSRGVPDDDPTACTHVFEDAPEDGTILDIDLTVRWRVGWRSNVIGLTDLQPLGEIEATTEDVPHPVVEVVGLAGSR